MKTIWLYIVLCIFSMSLFAQQTNTLKYSPKKGSQKQKVLYQKKDAKFLQKKMPAKMLNAKQIKQKRVKSDSLSKKQQ